LLGWTHDSPAWLAFQLAHEIGHIVEGHVSNGPVVDVQSSIFETTDETVETADIERVTDKFAKKILTGRDDLSFKPKYGLTADRLVAEVRRLQVQEQIDPGTLVLIYGYTANRMPVAQSALDKLGLKTGGQEIIKSHVLQYIPDDLPESIEAALQLIGIEQDITPCLLTDF
jgi:hypothetical protein